MKRWILLILLGLALVGIFDAGYLTLEHYRGAIPPCGVTVSFFSDCGRVLSSPYAVVFGVPLALIGFFFYTIEYLFLTLSKFKWARMGAVITTTGGFFASLYFIFLQVVIIRGICRYCMVSALISILLFFGVQLFFWLERKALLVWAMGEAYRRVLKPLLFLIDPEFVHVHMVEHGRMLGEIPGMSHLFDFALKVRDPKLETTIAGIHFPNPVGLAAGFDYEANLTQIGASLGFGFQTIGTITNLPYEGNPKPMLGRLPKSKSLMVNKGYKNLGADATIAKLSGKIFLVPIGVSIGKTNHKTIDTQEKAINDIVSAFEKFERSSLNHSYYELNISCPNLYGNVTFYPPKNLEALLRAIKKLNLTRPLFVKMPIEKTDKEYKEMLDVIVRYTPVGVIVGNLAKDRNNSAIVASEKNIYSVGNFSGKPTWESSNHLIEFTHKHSGKRLVIIGCGGIFSAEDAKEKLRLGASLVQLITGMIYQGPQLISEINQGILTEFILIPSWREKSRRSLGDTLRRSLSRR